MKVSLGVAFIDRDDIASDSVVAHNRRRATDRDAIEPETRARLFVRARVVANDTRLPTLAFPSRASHLVLTNRHRHEQTFDDVRSRERRCFGVAGR